MIELIDWLVFDSGGRRSLGAFSVEWERCECVQYRVELRRLYL